MVALGVAGALATWFGYSAFRRQQLDRSTFLAMQLLSETRQPDGNPSSLISKLSLLPTVAEIPKKRNIQFLAGNQMTDSPSSSSSTIYKCTDALYVRPTADKTSYSLFGYKPRPTQSLRQLAQQHTKRFTIYEDITTRLAYMKGIQESQTLDVDVEAKQFLKGAYTYCFRDYVSKCTCISLS
jgi:hypothetical protein